MKGEKMKKLEQRISILFIVFGVLGSISACGKAPLTDEPVMENTKITELVPTVPPEDTPTVKIAASATPEKIVEPSQSQDELKAEWWPPYAGAWVYTQSCLKILQAHFDVQQKKIDDKKAREELEAAYEAIFAVSDFMDKSKFTEDTQPFLLDLKNGKTKLLSWGDQLDAGDFSDETVTKPLTDTCASLLAMLTNTSIAAQSDGVTKETLNEMDTYLAGN